jgi:hypothetical protein
MPKRVLTQPPTPLLTTVATKMIVRSSSALMKNDNQEGARSRGRGIGMQMRVLTQPPITLLTDYDHDYDDEDDQNEDKDMFRRIEEHDALEEFRTARMARQLIKWGV